MVGVSSMNACVFIFQRHTSSKVFPRNLAVLLVPNAENQAYKCDYR